MKEWQRILLRWELRSQTIAKTYAAPLALRLVQQRVAVRLAGKRRPALPTGRFQHSARYEKLVGPLSQARVCASLAQLLCLELQRIPQAVRRSSLPTGPAPRAALGWARLRKGFQKRRSWAEGLRGRP